MDAEDIIKAIPNGLMTADLNGHLLTCNPAACNLFRIEENQKYNIYELIKPSESNKGQVLLLEDLVKQPQPIALTALPKQGTSFAIDLYVSKLSQQNGVVYLMMVIYRKAQPTGPMQENSEFMNMARRAGMSDVANTILHNIGNVLNSVNVSISLLKEKTDHSDLFTLTQAAQCIEEQHDNLSHFLTQDPRGICFPDYICLLDKSWKSEYALIQKELNLLSSKVEHIKHIIQMQLSLDTDRTMTEMLSINNVINDAIIMNNLQLDQYGITLKIDCADIGNVLLDKVKLLQILVNLLKNAKDSLKDRKASDKWITIKSYVNQKQNIIIQVTDNGLGISEENLKKVFIFGFTTKKYGHGYGLHASALAAKEMGGTLSVTSDGLNKGAAFTVEIPYKKALVSV